MDSIINMPLYVQVSDRIRRNIDIGEYGPEERIPTETELEKEYGVSRITIRKAIDILVGEGLLVRYPRRGTYVVDKKHYTNLNIVGSFSQRCRMEGKKPGAVLLSAELNTAQNRDIEELGVEKGDSILKIRRKRLCDGMPVAIETNYFHKNYSFLFSEDLTGSLYEVLAKNGIVPFKSVTDICVTHATKEEAEILNIEQDAPLLFTRSLVYDKNGNVIFRGKDVSNPDLHHYKVIQGGE